jgi:hypothetical protein
VPWVTAGNPHGFELALNWIDSQVEHIAASGWATLSNIVALRPDSELDMEQLRELLKGLSKTSANLKIGCVIT